MARVLLLLLLLMVGGIGSATAATIGEAWAMCQSHANSYPPGSAHCEDRPAQSMIAEIWNAGGSINATFQYTSGCPENTSWSDEQGACVSVCAGGFGMDPDNPSECMTPAKCLAKNDSLGSSISVYDTDTHGCAGGCGMSMGTDYETDAFSSGGQSRTLFRGKMRYTGAACTTPVTKAPDQEPECFEINGQSICKRNDGKLCQKAVSTGRYICWNPGETGQKTDGPDLHKRDPASNPQPPLPPDSGDTLVPNGNPVTNTTTNNTTNNTTSTVTNTYTTQNGTNAGPNNQGTPDPGEGDGEGEGQDDGQTVAGGGSCAEPPICSKPGTIECTTLIVEWNHACDASQTYGDNFWGGIFQQFGDATEEPTANLGTNIGMDGNGDLDNHRKVIRIEATEFDESGFLGGGSCPAFPTPTVNGVAMPIDLSKLCEMLANVGNIVLALSYFIGFKIVATGRR